MSQNMINQLTEEDTVKRQIGVSKNGNGVSIIFKYIGLNIDVYLTVPQAMNLVKAIGCAVSDLTEEGLMILLDETEERPN